jgi:DNA-binding NarL/FixJ family response regulator
MCVRIRAVIIEDEALTAQYLAELLDDTCQVEAVGSATESKAGCVFAPGCGRTRFWST